MGRDLERALFECRAAFTDQGDGQRKSTFFSHRKSVSVLMRLSRVLSSAFMQMMLGYRRHTQAQTDCYRECGEKAWDRMNFGQDECQRDQGYTTGSDSMLCLASS